MLTKGTRLFFYFTVRKQAVWFSPPHTQVSEPQPESNETRSYKDLPSQTVSCCQCPTVPPEKRDLEQE